MLLVVSLYQIVNKVALSDNNLLCLICFALAKSAALHLNTALKTPSNENLIFNDVHGVFLYELQHLSWPAIHQLHPQKNKVFP